MGQVNMKVYPKMRLRFTATVREDFGEIPSRAGVYRNPNMLRYAGQRQEFGGLSSVTAVQIEGDPYLNGMHWCWDMAWLTDIDGDANDEEDEEL